MLTKEPAFLPCELCCLYLLLELLPKFFQLPALFCQLFQIMLGFVRLFNCLLGRFYIVSVRLTFFNFPCEAKSAFGIAFFLFGIMESSYQIIKEHTKTQKNRRIPLTDELLHLLSEIRNYNQVNFPDSPFLFPSKDSADGAIGTNCVPSYLKKICRRLNIPVSADAIRGTHAFRRNIAKDINDSDMASKVLGNDVPVLEKNYYDGLDLVAARNAMKNSPILRREGQKTA